MRDHPGFDFHPQGPFDIPFSAYENSPPPDEVFRDVQSSATYLWHLVASYPNYADEKIAYVQWVQNYRSNVHSILAGFDSINQGLLWTTLQPATRAYFESLRACGTSCEQAANFPQSADCSESP